jgi:hypothetical protein
VEPQNSVAKPQTRDAIKVTIRYCYDPEARELEYREYNYIARVEFFGHWREHFFERFNDAVEWVKDVTLSLANKAYWFLD